MPPYALCTLPPPLVETFASLVKQEGEVCVSGPNVMQGYNNLPEASAEVLFDLDGQRQARAVAAKG